MGPGKGKGTGKGKGKGKPTGKGGLEAPKVHHIMRFTRPGFVDIE